MVESDSEQRIDRALDFKIRGALLEHGIVVGWINDRLAQYRAGTATFPSGSVKENFNRGAMHGLESARTFVEQRIELLQIQLAEARS